MSSDQLVFWEKPESGRFSSNGKEFELLFNLSGTDDRNVAEFHVKENTELEIGLIPRVDITAQIVKGHTDLWDVTISYASAGTPGGGIEPGEIGDERTSVAARGKTTRIFQAIEHIADYANTDIGEDPPNHEGAINVTTERIEGVEIDESEFALTVTKIIADSQLTPVYNRLLFLARGKVNSELWRGFQPGELRLINVQYDQRDAESWEVVFDFLASPNVTNQTVGDINGIDKLGHEYAWAEHVKLVDETTDPPTVRSKLKAVHIERMFDIFDFSLLGLLP